LGQKANGVSLIGFFPEFYVPGYHTCETILSPTCWDLRVKLSASGSCGHYWDDVGPLVTENQSPEQNSLTSADAAYRCGGTLTQQACPVNTKVGKGVPSATSVALPVGLHPTISLTVIWEPKHPSCIAAWAMARALYYVWEHILSSRNDELRVNLLLNRASPGRRLQLYPL